LIWIWEHDRFIKFGIILIIRESCVITIHDHPIYLSLKKTPHWNTLFYSLIPQHTHTQKKEKKNIENPESKREIN
jgi:hypothetical protein